ncbi:MAG: hypothetical protein F4Y60_00560 [Boseongicola sp. SB0664_bin_43]|uniref:Uncharacterized protein n=1 Tax=Boseongicola sp. SB0664_bin_43 TaxID=2604844 RepID=A0A6B0XY50_9RHOB|nr:hypothetical protein [Boseongicola sp. SB0664_bin_43]MYK32619.1 hypothetical protein [Boseongicola sp. SB0670_bin_30]
MPFVLNRPARFRMLAHGRAALRDNSWRLNATAGRANREEAHAGNAAFDTSSGRPSRISTAASAALRPGSRTGVTMSGTSHGCRGVAGRASSLENLVSFDATTSMRF